MNWTIFLQYWGAVLATVLGCIRIWEFVRDRRQIHTTFSSDIEGKKIVASINGKNSVFVQSFILYWRRSRYFGKKIEVRLAFHDDNVIESVMSIDKPLSLIFKEENDFSTSHAHAQKRKLYLGLYLAGTRRPVIVRVC